jgi:hypothetical protein
VDGEEQGAMWAAPTAVLWVPRLSSHGLAVAGKYLDRLLIVVTVIALGALALVSWQVHAAGLGFEMMGMGLPLFAVGLAWLATFAVAVWLVRVEWSGLSLALIVVGLGALGNVLGRAVPPGLVEDRMTFAPDVGELAFALQFSLVCAVVAFVVWAVWASVPTSRRVAPRRAIAGLGVGIASLLVLAWGAVPAYPPGFVD